MFMFDVSIRSLSITTIPHHHCEVLRSHCGAARTDESISHPLFARAAMYINGEEEIVVLPVLKDKSQGIRTIVGILFILAVVLAAIWLTWMGCVSSYTLSSLQHGTKQHMSESQSDQY